MKNDTQITFNLIKLPGSREEMMPLQELVANPVTYRFERSMADILAERAGETIFKIAAPVFIP